MQDRDLIAEAGAHAGHDLVGEGDLGNQHQRLASGGAGLGEGAQVDLGLAAAGDPVQQEGLGHLTLDGVADRAQGEGLILRELDRVAAVEEVVRGLEPRPLLEDDEPPPVEGAQQGRRARVAAGERSGRETLCGGGDPTQQRGLLIGPGEQTITGIAQVEAGREPHEAFVRDPRARSPLLDPALDQAVPGETRQPGVDVDPGKGARQRGPGRGSRGEMLEQRSSLAAQGVGRHGALGEGALAAKRERPGPGHPRSGAGGQRMGQRQSDRTEDLPRRIA